MIYFQSCELMCMSCCVLCFKGSLALMSCPAIGGLTRESSLMSAQCATKSSPGVTTCPNTPRCTGVLAPADWSGQTSDPQINLESKRESYDI